MPLKFITLTSANRIDKDAEAGIEIVANPKQITHFHRGKQKERNLTHIHFSGGNVALVTETVEEVKKLIERSRKGSAIYSPEMEND